MTGTRRTRVNAKSSQVITLRTMVGDMDESARLPGLTKFCGAGGRNPGGGTPGIEKSSISLLSTMPVEGERTIAPKG